MTLKERAGRYKGSTEIKIRPITTIKVNIDVNIHEDGNINTSYNAVIKKEAVTFNLDPNLQDNSIDISISGINIHANFNENKSININLPNTISGLKIVQTNVTLQRC